jgi:hypothetical protein
MLHLEGGRSTGSSFTLATIVQLTSYKVHPVNRWKNLGHGYPAADLLVIFSAHKWGERQLWSFPKRNSGQVWNLTAETAGGMTIARIYRTAAVPVTCKIICVPASNFTLRLAELITEPWALPAAAVFKATPCIPTTPRVAELIAPFAATPVA